MQASDLTADQEIIRQQLIDPSPVLLRVVFEQNRIELDMFNPGEDVDLRAFRVDFENLCVW